MAKKENMSKAELYREERKERIAKANKKNAKSLAAGRTVAGIVKKIVAVVVVVAIVAGVGYTLVDNFGVIDNLATALTVGGTKVSAADYEYYYSSMYQQTANYASYYSQYGYDMGFSTDVPLDEQMTQDHDGNEVTYAEFFKEEAKEKAQFVVAYCAEAEKAGFELAAEDKNEIDEAIESYKTNASQSGYSLNAYLRANFGGAFNEKKFRKLLETESTASKYQEKKQEEMKNAVEDKRIKDEYKKNKAQYDYADIVYYSIAYDVLTADEGEKDEALKKRQDAANKKTDAKANEAFAKIKDAKSFNEAVKPFAAAEDDEKDATYTTELKKTTYSSVESAISADAAKWALSSDRKANDKKLFTTDTGAVIVLISKPAYTSNSVDVRHILISFNAADEENVTDKEKKEAKKKAEELLKKWKDGEATEESFIALVADNTGDEGSKENGGLYAGIRVTDSYVEEFLDWSFDPSRKAGDTGIIETTYGYHIMFFSKDNTKDLDWQNTIRTNFGSDDFTKFDEELLGDEGNYKIAANDFWCSRVTDKFCKKLKKNIALSAAQQ